MWRDGRTRIRPRPDPDAGKYGALGGHLQQPVGPLAQLDGPPVIAIPSSSCPPAPPLLELRGITKRFSETIANEQIDFDLVPGEVHALLGENSVRKSTLMNVLVGLYRPDEGEIRVHGQPLALSSRGTHSSMESGWSISTSC